MSACLPAHTQRSAQPTLHFPTPHKHIHTSVVSQPGLEKTTRDKKIIEHLPLIVRNLLLLFSFLFTTKKILREREKNHNNIFFLNTIDKVQQPKSKLFLAIQETTIATIYIYIYIYTHKVRVMRRTLMSQSSLAYLFAFHSSVLEPDFDLSFRQLQLTGDLPPLLAGDVGRVEELVLQHHRLVARVRLPLLSAFGFWKTHNTPNVMVNQDIRFFFVFLSAFLHRRVS